MEKEIAEPEYQEETEPKQSSVQNSADIRVAAGIGFVLLIFLVSGIAVYKKEINHHRYQ